MVRIAALALLLTAHASSTASPAAALDDGSRYAFTASSSEKRVYALDMREQRIAERVKEAKLIHGTKMLLLLLPDFFARSSFLQLEPLKIRFAWEDNIIDAK